MRNEVGRGCGEGKRECLRVRLVSDRGGFANLTMTVLRGHFSPMRRYDTRRCQNRISNIGKTYDEGPRPSYSILLLPKILCCSVVITRLSEAGG